MSEQPTSNPQPYIQSDERQRMGHGCRNCDRLRAIAEELSRDLAFVTDELGNARKDVHSLTEQLADQTERWKLVVSERDALESDVNLLSLDLQEVKADRERLMLALGDKK